MDKLFKERSWNNFGEIGNYREDISDKYWDFREGS